MLTDSYGNELFRFTGSLTVERVAAAARRAARGHQPDQPALGRAREEPRRHRQLERRWARSCGPGGFCRLEQRVHTAARSKSGMGAAPVMSESARVDWAATPLELRLFVDGAAHVSSRRCVTFRGRPGSRRACSDFGQRAARAAEDLGRRQVLRGGWQHVTRVRAPPRGQAVARSAA